MHTLIPINSSVLVSPWVNNRPLKIVTSTTTSTTPFVFTPRLICDLASTVAMASTMVTLATSEPCSEIPITGMVRLAPLSVSPQRRMLTSKTMVAGIIR